jgi:sulfur carrier protein
MRIILNGTPHEVPDQLTVTLLVEHLQLPAPTLLIEVNEIALRKSEWTDHVLKPDDRIEFVRIAAGG